MSGPENRVTTVGLKLPSRNDAVGFEREQSRPGCGSVRRRAEPARLVRLRMVWAFRPHMWVATARPKTTKVGALPNPRASFRPGIHTPTALVAVVVNEGRATGVLCSTRNAFVVVPADGLWQRVGE